MPSPLSSSSYRGPTLPRCSGDHGCEHGGMGQRQLPRPVGDESGGRGNRIRGGGVPRPDRAISGGPRRAHGGSSTESGLADRRWGRSYESGRERRQGILPQVCWTRWAVRHRRRSGMAGVVFQCAHAAEQGDEADEPLGGTRPGLPEWRGWRRRLVPAQARNRGYRLAAYRQCSADRRGRSGGGTEIANGRGE